MQVKLLPRTCWCCTVAAGSWDSAELPPPTDLSRILSIIRTGSSDGLEDRGIIVSDASFAIIKISKHWKRFVIYYLILFWHWTFLWVHQVAYKSGPLGLNCRIFACFFKRVIKSILLFSILFLFSILSYCYTGILSFWIEGLNILRGVMKFHSITIDMSSRVTTGVRRCNVELLWDKAMFWFFFVL